MKIVLFKIAVHFSYFIR